LKQIRIADRTIGEGAPVFIVVETGTTANGDLETALRMVDAAVDGGADAVKFQMIGPEYFMSDTSVTYEYEWAGGRRAENMFEMFQGLTFTPEEWTRIRDYCDERGILFYSSIDYIKGVELGEELGVPCYKLSSWDVGNVPLIQAMARTGKPIHVDLGPATVLEIQKLVDVAATEGNDQIILIHCSHSLTDEGINLNSIPYLESVFGVPTGYSADSRDFVPDLVSVGLGAKLLEKRVTLDHTYEGHHHVKAVEPHEFKEWVEMIRRAEAVQGEYAVKPSPEDLRQKELYFVSLVADEDIPAGTTISRDMVACKRPGTGIAPEFLDLVVGRIARRDVCRNELLAWDAV